MARKTQTRRTKGPGTGANGRRYSASIDRAARVLMALSGSTEPVSLPNISRRAGLEKSTAFRILCTLAAQGMVTQDETTGSYSLGFLTLRFADQVLGALPAHDAARRIMRELRDRTAETVVLSIRDGWNRVNADYLASTQAIVQTQQIGVPFPLHIAAPGLVILASLDEAQGEQYFASEEFRTTATSTQVSSIRARIRQARDQGYLVSSGECTPGGTVLAVAIKPDSGDVFGALHVAAPASRWSAEVEKRCARLVEQSARRIAEAIAGSS